MYVDLIYGLRYKFANAMMELQNPHRDGLHFTKAVNIFLYRNVKSKLDEMGLSSSKMPRHWPATLSGAYSTFADDDVVAAATATATARRGDGRDGR